MIFQPNDDIRRNFVKCHGKRSSPGNFVEICQTEYDTSYVHVELSASYKWLSPPRNHCYSSLIPKYPKQIS